MKRAIFLAGAMLALSVGAAHAATGDYKGAYQFEFSGTVSGNDTYGVFGVKGATLNNAAFTETVSLDLSKGSERTATNYVDWTSNSASFMVSSITIGSQTYNFSSGGAQSAALDNGSTSSSEYGYSRYISLSDSQTATFAGVSGLASTGQFLLGTPADFGNRFSASAAGGYFSFDPSGCDPTETLHLRDVVATAPEPQAWALLMMGVAMLGYALGRGRRTSPVLAGV